MTHKICLSAAALLALLLALPAPALAYDGATPDQPNRLSAGLSHTAYVDEHGTLWTWGSNQEGQLGAETQETGVDREGNQVAVSGTSLAVLEDVCSVAAGGDFTVALKTDGTLWAWGGNDYGQLGNGTVVSAAQPVQVQTADAGAVRVDIPSQKGMDRVPLVLLALSGAVLVVAGVVTRRH